MAKKEIQKGYREEYNKWVARRAKCKVGTTENYKEDGVDVSVVRTAKGCIYAG